MWTECGVSPPVQNKKENWAVANNARVWGPRKCSAGREVDRTAAGTCTSKAI